MESKTMKKFTETMLRGTQEDPEWDLVVFMSGEAELSVTKDWWKSVGRPEEITVSVEVPA